jgi:hypothetical protein
MVSRFRTLSARLITRHRLGPRILQIRAWAWLAGEAGSLAEKERCIEAILALEPELEWVQMALSDIRFRRGRAN